MIEELIGGTPDERRLRNGDHPQSLHAIENLVVDEEVREVLDAMAVVGARVFLERCFERVEREVLRARSVAVDPDLPPRGVSFHNLFTKLLAAS